VVLVTIIFKYSILYSIIN